MIDNSELIRKQFYFNEANDMFFHCQIVQRAKDHPNEKVKEGAIHTYFIRSKEHLERLMSEIKLLCNFYGARGILPLDTATEVNHCAFVSDWKHFFKLRASHAGAKGMHPDMDLIANKVYDEFKSKKYI